jgi:hypothetical protein
MSVATDVLRPDTRLREPLFASNAAKLYRF